MAFIDDLAGGLGGVAEGLVKGSVARQNLDMQRSRIANQNALNTISQRRADIADRGLALDEQRFALEETDVLAARDRKEKEQAEFNTVGNMRELLPDMTSTEEQQLRVLLPGTFDEGMGFVTGELRERTAEVTKTNPHAIGNIYMNSFNSFAQEANNLEVKTDKIINELYDKGKETGDFVGLSREEAELKIEQDPDLQPSELKKMLANQNTAMQAMETRRAFASQFNASVVDTNVAGGLTGETKNRFLATQAVGQGDTSLQEAVDATAAAKLERSKVQGTFKQEGNIANVQRITEEITPLVDSIFTSSNLLERASSGIKNTFSLVTQEGANAVDIAQYTSLVNGVAGQFAKVVSGEGGRLTDQDIARVKGLFPLLFGIGGLPDSQPVAQRKLKFLVKSLEEERKRLLEIQGIKPKGTLFDAGLRLSADGMDDILNMTDAELEAAIEAERAGQ